MYYCYCQRRSPHLGASWLTTQEMLGGQFCHSRDLTWSLVSKPTSGERERDYIKSMEGTTPFALYAPAWSISVKNKAESKWILLTEYSQESFASPISRNWFSTFPIKTSIALIGLLNAFLWLWDHWHLLGSQTSVSFSSSSPMQSHHSHVTARELPSSFLTLLLMGHYKVLARVQLMYLSGRA